MASGGRTKRKVSRIVPLVAASAIATPAMTSGVVVISNLWSKVSLHEYASS
jgi:hypothetical protein